MLDGNKESPTGGDVEHTEPPTIAEKALWLSSSLIKWREKIERALALTGGGYSYDHVCAMVLTGQAHLYDYDDTLLIMQVIDFPNYRSYHCFIACGNINSVPDKDEEMCKVARELGCREITANGRPGWPRIAKKVGWKQRLALIYKEV